MTKICISCGLDSDAIDENSAKHLMKKDYDGNWHWKECHNVGGDLNANKSPYDFYCETVGSKCCEICPAFYSNCGARNEITK
jgi:hypothetical protein